jgi:hypothetical protein
MLKPKVDIKEFEKHGFKKCKGKYGELNCYYLCISRGCKMMFVSPEIFDVVDWNDNDERIHSVANCRYRDNRTYFDVIYDLIKADLLETETPRYLPRET